MFTLFKIGLTFLGISFSFFTLSSEIISYNLVSTESDTDAFIQDCVNVINGDYCECATDLMITGPDTLILQKM
jgi:hypothetical protein